MSKPTATPVVPAEVATPAAPASTPCRCGCGLPTVRAEARYVAGHDARHAGQVARDLALDPQVVFADAPRLAAKAEAVRATSARRAAEKVARKAAQVKAKAAYAEALKAALAG